MNASPVIGKLYTEFSGVGHPTAKLDRVREKFISGLESKTTLVREGSRCVILADIDVAKGARRGAVGIVRGVVRGDRAQTTGVLMDLGGTRPFLIEPQKATFVDEKSTCTVIFWPIANEF